jgi:hypothetical protein
MGVGIILWHCYNAVEVWCVKVGADGRAGHAGMRLPSCADSTSRLSDWQAGCLPACGAVTHRASSLRLASSISLCSLCSSGWLQGRQQKAAASHIIKVLCWALVAGKKACHTLPADPARTQHRPLLRQPVQAAACPPARQHRPPAPAPRLPVASKAARAPHLKLYAVPGRPWKTSMLGSRHFTM